MYTQCPDCATAFRVTADILKQAGGKVRCGGCGNAFNALAYLSETKPAALPPTDESQPLPELTPDRDSDTREVPPPRAISAEQSAALLKTLDELAGTDIRLEDTGVEWRLLSDDEDEFGDDALQLPDDMETPVDAEFSGENATAVDEFLDDTPAQVDEFLPETPSRVEASEVFEDIEDRVEAPGVFDEIEVQVQQAEIFSGEGSPDELRFDDHTGLPDDGDAVASHDSTHAAEDFEAPEFEPEPEFIEPHEHTETQVDIVFGEPDEWGELLDEVEVSADVGEIDKPSLEVRGEIIEPEPDAGPDGEPKSLSLEDELDALDDELLDIDTQFDVQAEALGIAQSGVHASDDSGSFPDSTGELETELAKAQELSDRVLTELVKHGVDGESLESIDDLDSSFNEASLEFDDETDDDIDDEIALEAGDSASDIPAPVMLPETEEEQTINRMIDQDLLRLAIENDGGNASTMALQDDADTKEGPGQKGPAFDVPGFPSWDSGVETIIMEGEFVRTALEQEALEAEAAREQQPEENAFIAAAKKTFRGKFQQKDDDEAKPKRNYRMAAGLALLGVLLAGQLVHQSRAALATIPAVNNVIAPIYRIIGAPITPRWDVTSWKFEVTRETLSGGELIIDSAAEGVAVEGADIEDVGNEDTGGTSQNTAGADAARTQEILTIYSRLGNSGDHPLPYPLITVSLTDRYEETIGSTVLEPGDYLAGQADVSRLITPGNTFEAVIPIESPSGDATGYKLNVCYRHADDKLRCAVEDFK